MAARTTMYALIDRVRHLIYDPAGADQVFTDDEIQDALDRHRLNVHYLSLTPQETRALGEATAYYDYYAVFGDWEDGPTVVDCNYDEISSEDYTFEPIVGHWTFTESKTPPVYATGWVYDVYAAAADLLEAWAAREKLAYDFTSEGQSLRRSQKAQALQELARTYRRQQRPMSVGMVRSDVV